MKELLIKKYQEYIDNIAWHIRTNKPDINKEAFYYERMAIYEAFIEDLKKLS